MAKDQSTLGLQEEKREGPVECLGMTFESDEARREHFLSILREKLQDPEFRKIEGFPIGEDEDILALSDPPYYTACPNPFLEDFIKCYGKPYDPETDDYHREPFAADVSEGKGDYLYSAHVYHTKVPPQAIARYILHYTKPGDVVLDPFAGSGMTGLAALLCGQPAVLDPERAFGEVEWGRRIPLVGDLSPAATAISSVYLAPPEAAEFEIAAERALNEVVAATRDEWMLDGRQVSYFVKAEVFVCPRCQASIAPTNVVEMTDAIGAATEFPCPACRALVSKAPSRASHASRLLRQLGVDYDPWLGLSAPHRRETSVYACFGDNRKPQIRRLSEAEAEALDRTAPNTTLWVPTDPLVQGERCLVKDLPSAYGITHIHHFYTPRQLRYIAGLWDRASSMTDHTLKMGLRFWVQSYHLGATRLNRFIPPREGRTVPGSQVNRHFTGTLYIPSMLAEVSPDYLYRRKIAKTSRAFDVIGSTQSAIRCVTTQSATGYLLPPNSIDYAFIDPPFGQNLQYSELNQIWEAWLRVYTDRGPEAVVDQTRHRDVTEYGRLMERSFEVLYHCLKPGRWVTLEFHNSRNAVWAAIQEAMFRAGFIVADVRVLDKQQETYKQSRQGLVKQDLIISAYKPNGGLEDRFRLEAGTEDGVWDFVRTHLRQLPVFVSKDGQVEVVAERQDYLLFDRMVAFHVQRGVTIPLSAAEFYAGLRQRFPERDGMFFLPEQVTEYDRKRLSAREVMQLQLFVTDESSAIQWVRQQLLRKPQTFQDLQPQFMQEVKAWLKHEKTLELAELLAENFLCYDGDGEVPSQIHAYLSSAYHDLRNLAKDDPALVAQAVSRWYVPDPNKEADLEKIRLRSLMKEFEEYRAAKGKLKVVRTEALRAGFKTLWGSSDYAGIVDLAKRLPEAILQEDPRLLMYYDNALMRLEG
jgi:hypothetical protein